MDGTWKEMDSYSAENTAIAASASEAIVPSASRFNRYNRLLVQNLDVVDIEVRLDQLDISGKVFRVSKNGGYIVIEPDAGIEFRSVQNVNLSAADAQTAGAILFRFGYAVKVVE